MTIAVQIDGDVGVTEGELEPTALSFLSIQPSKYCTVLPLALNLARYIYLVAPSIYELAITTHCHTPKIASLACPMYAIPQAAPLF